jgi:hypothetical protein
LMRYKVTDKYSIDSGLLGPTEVKVMIALILVAEVVFPESVLYSAAVACVVLLIVNIKDTHKLLRLADDRDRAEKEVRYEKDH